MRFVIDGRPITKKTGQRILRNASTGAPFIASKVTAKAWEKTAAEQLLTQRPRTIFAGPVAVCALIYRDGEWGDLVGYLQAIGDALEKGRIIINDKLIESWDGSRRLIESEATPS